MMVFRIEPGQRLRIDGVLFTILSRDEAWRLLSPETLEARLYNYDDLARLYVEGRLVPDYAVKDRDAPDNVSRLLEDLPQPDQDRANLRLSILRRAAALLEMIPAGARAEGIHRALALASHEFGLERPTSRASYYRWRGKLRRGDICDLAGRFHDRGRRPLAPLVREVANEVMGEAVQLASQPRNPEIKSLTWMRGEIEARLAERNFLRCEAGQEPLAPLKRSTFYAIWNARPAHERDIWKHGRRETRALYRRPSPNPAMRPMLPLDLGEYDETRLPIFFFDEVTLAPLGRPLLAWIVDAVTEMPTGFYLGFEPAGDLTFAATVRHACLPKTYVGEVYPQIVHPYRGHGRHRHFTFDNEAAVHGRTADLITKDLLSHFSIAPSHTPWFKSRVEHAFHALNQQLMQELPGFVLSRHLSPSEYDPTQNGCIGLRFFLFIFHAWLIDVYCQQPTECGRTPDERWSDGTAQWSPDLLSRAQDLDILFGVVRRGRLDHRGVVYENLWYFSDELQDLRLQTGHTQDVSVKINPSDLGAVHIRHPREDRWVRAQARRPDYAAGLSLHCHILNAKEAGPGTFSVDALLRAQARLRELVSENASIALSIQAAALGARFNGIGTQHVFNNLDVEGRLGALTGPFRGQSLNPLPPGTVLPSDPPARTDDATRGDVASAAAPTPARAREIPMLHADRSLSRSRST